ncbi:MAG TPA: 3-deoxy-D-manno-octulosonic acid transferase [Candidatus Limnocylindria bacterium]|nr:3-deoxy-D-manno-octulosonic acid transferase [Candidatus Limnocylindria bacterium]
MIRWLYNVLFNIGLLVSSPHYLLKMVRRGRWRAGFSERFGKYDSRLKQALTNRDVIWFHAVSVGEVNLCMRLIREIEPHLPNFKVVVSTTTSTGMAELRKRMPSQVSCIYYPIDRRQFVQRAIWVIRPSAVVLVEAEIWPNFLWYLRRKSIPHFLVNARMSQRSARGYRRFGFLFRDIFAGFAGVGVQTEADAETMVGLGCRPEAVHAVGNLKFDSAVLEDRRLTDAGTILGHLGVTEETLVLVAGSTHDGEEEILAHLVLKLRSRFPNLFLVLVPRHHERGGEVSNLLKSVGVRHLCRTEVTALTRCAPGSLDCLLVNTTGELRFFYQAADLVFVGKSLTAEGGQNPIEPAALGRPVVVGPNMQNFPDIMARFNEQNALIQVKDAAGLEKALTDLLASQQLRQEYGTRARNVVKQNQGAVGRTVDFILAELKNQDDGRH